MYEIAVSSSDDQKISAAKVFCGASLSRGWNVQVMDFKVCAKFDRMFVSDCICLTWMIPLFISHYNQQMDNDMGPRKVDQ